MSAIKTATPPLGWNSFDCYGIYANEAALNANLDAFVKKLAAHGYEYFVLDAGWYYDFPPDAAKREIDFSAATDIHLNENGVLTPPASFLPD